jgi:hypothetical protein
MSKTPPTPRPPITADPFKDAPRFNPFSASPLSSVAADAARGYGARVESAEEWNRSKSSPAASVAPTSQSARAPFPQRVNDVAPFRPNTPRAGGSK